MVSVSQYSNVTERFTITLNINSSHYSYTCPDDDFPANIVNNDGNVTFNDNCTRMELFITIPPTVQLLFSLTVETHERGVRNFGPYIIGMESKYSSVVTFDWCIGSA